MTALRGTFALNSS